MNDEVFEKAKEEDMTELQNQREFVKINGSDFPTSHFRKPESHLRSLEHYLRINNREYNFEGQDCTIYVYDKADAMRIGLHFGLKSIEYFDGEKFQSVNLKEEKPKRLPRTMVTDLATGEIMTLHQFKNHQSRKYAPEGLDRCITRASVIKRKLLTKAELETAVERGELKEIKYKKIIYINGDELTNYFKRRIS